MVPIPRLRLTLRDRILSLLDQHPDTEFNTKTIARKLRANYSSVRKELRRMVELKLIENPHYGFYRSKNVIISTKGTAYPMPQMHGIKLHYRGEKCHTFYTESYLRTIFPREIIKRHGKNHALIVFAHPYIEGEHRDITITVHQHLMEVWLKTSDKPLTPQGLLEFSAWLQGKFGLDPSEFKLIQHGFNYDFVGIKMDGNFEINLKQFSNAVIRLYQHGDKLRYEMHRSYKEDEALNFEEALNILLNGIAGKKGTEKEYSELRRLIEEMNNKLDLLAEGMTTLIRAENAKISSQDLSSSAEKISGEVEGYA